MKLNRYRVMSFALGGNSSEGVTADGNCVSCSWYLRAEEMQQYLDNGHYSAAEYEGCILIDKRAALRQDAGLAFDSPMCDPRLAPGKVDRFAADALHPAAALVLAEVSRHVPMIGLMALKSAADSSYGGLDHVSPEDYAQWWREHGARIGRIESGRAIWETEDFATRVRAYEAEGLTTSDAQAVCDAEDKRAGRARE